MYKRPFYAAFLMMASLVGPAAAHDELVSARFTPRAGPNAFSVSFPPQLGGLQIEMAISGGEFTIALNEEEGTSRLTAWRQEIDPVTIAGASTGPIVVRLDENAPSTGTYDPVERFFRVSGTFILEFDDSQLRSLGFTSPFALNGTEQGTRHGSGQIGVIRMSMSGSGEFGLGQFSYTCRTSGEIKYALPAHLAQPGDVNHDIRFDVSDPLTMLDHLFMGNPAACPGALEVNGDGRQDISDVTYLFGFLFLGGAPPPPAPVACAP